MQNPKFFFTAIGRLFLLLLLAGQLAACNEDADLTTPAVAPITSEETVEIVEKALQSSTDGMSQSVADAAKVGSTFPVGDANIECGVTQDSTVTYSIDESRITASYTSTWNWLLNCTQNGFPQALVFERTAQGSYETARLSSDDQSTAAWTLSNLLQGTQYQLDGTYVRSGTQQFRVRDQRELTTELTLTVTGLSVNKGNFRIESGNAEFLLDGAGADGQTFKIEGEIIFQGDGQALLVINGATYPIDLN